MQVALLVAPLLVFAGMLFVQPMDLAFSTFEVASVGLAVWIAAVIVQDGESNWLEGAFLDIKHRLALRDVLANWAVHALRVRRPPRAGSVPWCSARWR